jgi:hypothetical protein
MNYWHGLLIGLFAGGTLGTLIVGLIASCRLRDDMDYKDRTAKEYVIRKQ